MALKGVMGKILWVDLGAGSITEEVLAPDLYEKFLGGYGLGAYLLYTRQKPNVDPMGPESILGVLTGAVTGTNAITGNRFIVVGKSPKTGTWGDANCGGTFGPALKRAGVDGVLFTGLSEKPVYLSIMDGKAELKDAAELWGLDSNETDDKLKEEYGKTAEVACIGPSGERCELLACIMNDKGRAAGRSGLGAVMGAKKLKAIVADGQQEIPEADPDKVKEIRKQQLDFFKQDNALYDIFSSYGTSGVTANACKTGDTPIKNWGGTPDDMPEVEKISDDAVQEIQEKKYGCWHCPIACGGHVKVESGPYPVETHKPEYETLGAFGTLCLNNNLESIVKVNDICNRAGIDTIATGATVAFAIECYENGLVTKEDTGGLELTWGNHEAIVALTDQIAKAEGFGAKFVNGMAKGADQIQADTSEYEMHVKGEELPMHDPRCSPGLGCSYQIDATPGRHTQMGAWFHEALFCPPGLDKYYDGYDLDTQKYVYSGKGSAAKVISNFGHVLNAAGFCMFGVVSMQADAMPAFLSAVTGKEYTMADVIETGARIAAMRTAFNLREGVNALDTKVPARMLGKPPLPSGPTKDVTVDSETQIKEYLEAMGWDPATGKPTKETLEALGLDFVAKDLYGG